MLELQYLTFNFVSTVAVTFINKAVFSRIDFGYPAMLCNVHFAVTWIGVEAMRRWGLFEPLKRPPSLRDKNFLSIVIVVGLVTPLNNASLKLNSMGFYQIFKLLLTPVVILFEYCLDGKVLSPQRNICLILVCMFVYISSRGDLEFSAIGTVFATLWIPLAATYKVQWGRVRRLLQCSTLALMHAVLPYAIVVQFMISPLVDPPGVSEYVWTPQAILLIGFSGVAAFMVNYSGFLVMGNIGALAHVLLGQLKTAVIMVGAYVVFHTHYSSLQIVGAFGAVLSIIAYTYVTVKEQSKKVVKSDIECGELKADTASS
jgi:solute carrier family 35 protein E3